MDWLDESWRIIGLVFGVHFANGRLREGLGADRVDLFANGVCVGIQRTVKHARRYRDWISVSQCFAFDFGGTLDFG